MKFKENIINRTYDSFEVKEPVKIRAIGSEAMLIPGKIFSVVLLEMMSGTPIKDIIEKELEKSSETNIWEISI